MTSTKIFASAIQSHLKWAAHDKGGGYSDAPSMALAIQGRASTSNTLEVCPEGRLDEIDFEGAIIEDIEFRRNSMIRADFTNATLKRVTFRSTDLSGAVFRNAKFVGCTLDEFMARRASFEGCTFERCKFVGCSFQEASFSDSSFDDFIMTESSLERASFRDATFSGAVTLRDVDANRSNWTGARAGSMNILRDSDVSGAVFSGVVADSFEVGADVATQGASWSGVVCPGFTSPAHRAKVTFVPLARSELAHKRDGYASCIALDTIMLTSRGPVTAGEILDRMKNGMPVEMMTAPLLRHGAHPDELAENPVIGACKTYAKGVRITYADGRSVALTTGHMLPVTEAIEIAASSMDLTSIPCTEQRLIRAGDVRPGMVLADGEVRSVERVGKINAARIWTEWPAMLLTESGLRVGSRWHEIIHGWAAVAESEDEDQPLGVPVEATGWVYEHPVEFSYNWITSDRRDLGMAWVIRATLAERYMSAMHDPAWYIPHRARRREMPSGWDATPLKTIKDANELLSSLIAGDEVLETHLLPA